MDDAAAPILLVEDDPSMRDALVTLLEGEGYSVRCAENGRQALDVLARSETPSLILLDLMMPVMDGWQFLAARRQVENADARGTPVVLLSGLGFIRGASDVADFLRKPIDAEALLGCVRRFARASTHPTV
ncbi:MAG TPA: response regulator [Thermoanaerobaculia bacterium]|nr:response regulator [Thermoanaerobaculia bacterium]